MAITLKAARVNAGFTQKQVCERLNISKNTLVSYEKHGVIPKMDRAKKLAELYGLSVDQIIFFKQ